MMHLPLGQKVVPQCCVAASGLRGEKRHKRELFILYTSVPFSLCETVIMCITQYTFKVNLKIRTQNSGKICFVYLEPIYPF